MGIVPQRRASRISRQREEWPALRMRVYHLVSDQKFEKLVGLVICFNFFLIVLETDMGSQCADLQSNAACIPSWIPILNDFLLVLYSVEASLRCFAFRSKYIQDGWNIFDLLIIVAGYVDMVITRAIHVESTSILQMLRIFRLVKLARVGRLLEFAPELKAMVQGFLSAMSAMMWGFLMIIIMLVIWAVLAVELLNDASREVHADNEFCKDAFSGVANASIWFFQTMVAGDSFGYCAVPLIKQLPLSLLIFSGALITIQLGFTNLILAVIVERASETREQDLKEKVGEEQLERKAAVERLSEWCSDIDRDGDGKLSLEELSDAYEQHAEFRDCLVLLGIDREKLKKLFYLMDSDDSGDVSYNELVDCLQSAEVDDLKKQMMLVNLRIEDIWMRVRHRVEVPVGHLVKEMQKTGIIQKPAPKTCLRKSFSDLSMVSQMPQEMPEEVPESELPTLLGKVQRQFETNLAASEKLLAASLENLRQRFEKELVVLARADVEKDEELQRLKRTLDCHQTEPIFRDMKPGDSKGGDDFEGQVEISLHKGQVQNWLSL